MKKTYKLSALLIFGTYILILTYLLFFFGYRRSVHGNLDFNVIPLTSILRDFTQINRLHIELLTNNLFGNILAFFPLGVLAPLVIKRIKSWKRLFILSFSMSLCAEVLQLIFRVGAFDVDDILLNITGALIGYIFYKGCFQMLFS